jgi:hypothetical protein
MCVSANRMPARSSGVRCHSSFFGVVSNASAGSPSCFCLFAWCGCFGGTYDFACGESLALKSAGAAGLIERAISMSPSVKTSAAKRRTVCPSTPVCSKLIPAMPLPQTMICSCGRVSQSGVLLMSGEVTPDLVVPPIRASADLDAVAELVGPAEIIRAQLGLVLGGKVVEAHDEEGIVHGLKALAVARMGGEHFAKAAPDFTVLGREHANRRASDVVLLDLVSVGTDRLEVEEDLALGQHRPVLRVEHIKIVWTPIDYLIGQVRDDARTGRTELAATDDDDVSGLVVDIHPAAAVCGDAGGAEEAGVLVHVEWDAADMVGFEQALTKVVDEAE